MKQLQDFAAYTNRAAADGFAVLSFDQWIQRRQALHAARYQTIELVSYHLNPGSPTRVAFEVPAALDPLQAQAQAKAKLEEMEKRHIQQNGGKGILHPVRQELTPQQRKEAAIKRLRDKEQKDTKRIEARKAAAIAALRTKETQNS